MSPFFRRRARRLVVALSLLVVAPWVPSTALAQRAADAKPPAEDAKPSAADAAEGKKHFLAGLALFKQKKVEEALVEFKESYRLGRRYTALKNAAQCHRELQQYVEAYEAFQRVLDDHGKDVPKPERKVIEKALKDLGTLTATVTVKANEDNAAIEVDGKVAGVTPLPKPVRVTAGRHKVTATKQGFDPAEKEIELTGQQEGSVELTLSPEVKIGRVAVRERTGADVRVLVDDQDMGPAPWEGDLEEGPHVLEVRGSKAAAALQTITVKRKDRIDLTVDAVSTVPRLKVVVPSPVGAEIALDGKRIGASTWEGEVTEGRHKVDVRAKGFKPSTTQMVVSAGEMRVHEVVLAADESNAPKELQEDPKRYWGTYIRFDLAAQFNTQQRVPVIGPCAPSDPLRSCDVTSYPEGAFAIRLGYTFDFVSLEAMAAVRGGAQVETLTAKGPALAVGLPTTASGGLNGATFKLSDDYSRTDQVLIANIAPFLGGGVRFTTHQFGPARFTLGGGPGVAFRFFGAKRSISGNIVGDTAAYTDFIANPGVMVDGGVYLGYSPGFKAMLGVLMMTDFVSNPILTNPISTGNSTVTGIPVQTPLGAQIDAQERLKVLPSGNQLYIGPVLSLQFGS